MADELAMPYASGPLWPAKMLKLIVG